MKKKFYNSKIIGFTILTIVKTLSIIGVMISTMFLFPNVKNCGLIGTIFTVLLFVTILCSLISIVVKPKDLKNSIFYVSVYVAYALYLLIILSKYNVYNSGIYSIVNLNFFKYNYLFCNIIMSGILINTILYITNSFRQKKV